MTKISNKIIPEPKLAKSSTKIEKLAELKDLAKLKKRVTVKIQKLAITKLEKLVKLENRVIVKLEELANTKLQKKSPKPKKPKKPKIPKEPKISKISKKPKTPKTPKISKKPKIPKIPKTLKIPKISKKPKAESYEVESYEVVKAVVGKKPVPLRLVEKSIYEKMKLMNTTDVFINKWQLQRIILALVAIFVSDFLLIFILKKPLIFALGGPVIGLVLYMLQHVSVNNRYKVYRFNRNLEFSKFARLIVPYLRQAKNGTSVYHIFSQMVHRIGDPIDRKLMQKLMIQITDHPSEIWPYLEFANSMSGTDFSITFMTLIYDISQGATDDNIIDELGKEVSQQLMDIISDIIEYKEKKFMMFPSLIVAPNMVLILGYMICIMIYQFKTLGL